MHRPGTPTPEECPSPEVHGNPFRYCPNCTWIEPSESKPARGMPLCCIEAFTEEGAGTNEFTCPTCSRTWEMPPR
jgi:hypothetical protein